MTRKRTNGTTYYKYVKDGPALVIREDTSLYRIGTNKHISIIHGEAREKRGRHFYSMNICLIGGSKL